jgi:hypothetical protein
MKDTGSGFHGKHLKSSLEYVMNPDKTQDGRLIGSINCQVDTAFEQMKETKRKFNKIDKRQGYHLVISFQEGEVDPNTAFEFAGRFVEEYLGKDYEAVYVVHDNTEHVHAHIIFNSVSFVDGKKYRYEKGDWAKYIQPITNRLAEEYGLSVLDIEEELKDSRYRKSNHYKEWKETREGKFIWSDMIKRDVDACILQAGDFQQFLEILTDKGYEVKQGKHLAVRPPGMNRFRRCYSLGAGYSEEEIVKRIPVENLEYYRKQQETPETKIVFCKVRRYKRARLSGLQKRYYARLYRLGQLKKRAYSQAWRYKDEIKRMQQLQRQYLFLVRHDVHTAEELVAAIDNINTQKNETHLEKSKVYRQKQKFKSLFETADKMKSVFEAEQAYQQGDNFFEDEHQQWELYKEQIASIGYSYNEVNLLKEHFSEQISEVSQREKAISFELKIGEAIWKDLIKDSDDDRIRETGEKDIIRDSRKQPTR